MKLLPVLLLLALASLSVGETKPVGIIGDSTPSLDNGPSPILRSLTGIISHEHVRGQGQGQANSAHQEPVDSQTLEARYLPVVDARGRIETLRQEHCLPKASACHPISETFEGDGYVAPLNSCRNCCSFDSLYDSTDEVCF